MYVFYEIREREKGWKEESKDVREESKELREERRVKSELFYSKTMREYPSPRD